MWIASGLGCRFAWISLSKASHSPVMGIAIETWSADPMRSTAQVIDASRPSGFVCVAPENHRGTDERLLGAEPLSPQRDLSPPRIGGKVALRANSPERG